LNYNTDRVSSQITNCPVSIGLYSTGRPTH